MASFRLGKILEIDISKSEMFFIALLFVISFSLVGAISQSFDDGHTQGHPLFQIDFSAGSANSNLDMGHNRIIDVNDPVSSKDAVNLRWAEDEIEDVYDEMSSLESDISSLESDISSLESRLDNCDYC